VQASNNPWVRAVENTAYMQVSFPCLSDCLVGDVLFMTGEASSVYSLSMVSSSIRSAFAEEVWKDKLQAVVQDCTKRYLKERSLNNFTFSTNIILSGSSMLQIMLGQIWHLGDTDIFCVEQAYGKVASMLLAEGYSSHGIKHTEYHEDNDGMETYDSDSDKSEERLMAYPTLREDRIGSVHSWSLAVLTPASTVVMKRLYVDVIIGKSSISNVNELLENSDIYACRASWNGCSASWLEAGATFRRSSRLHPLCLDLLVGFMQGLCDSDGRVDISMHQRLNS
jgi:hypothetical protein